MVREAVILAKVANARRQLARARARLPAVAATFVDDEDARDIVIHNMWQALQTAIDLAAHIVADEGYGQASSLGDLFDLLRQHGVVDQALAARLSRAVGLRNLIVHQYADLDFGRVFDVARDDLGDVDSFLIAVIDHFHLGED